MNCYLLQLKWLFWKAQGHLKCLLKKLLAHVEFLKAKDVRGNHKGTYYSLKSI